MCVYVRVLLGMCIAKVLFGVCICIVRVLCGMSVVKILFGVCVY